MTEVFVTDPSNNRPKNPSAARRGAAVFAAFGSLAMAASPIHGAFGAPPVSQVGCDDVHGEREPALSSRELSSALAEVEKWYSERFRAEAVDPARPNEQASSAERDPGTFHPLVDF
jgi:hypothetical protein